MMMKMLEAGGLPIFQDQIRRPDANNPLGYYEAERVRALRSDASWLLETQGHAIKIISALLKHLPASLSYKIIFMERPLNEILASQRRMLARRGKQDELDDRLLKARFSIHLSKTKKYLNARNIPVLHCPYGGVISDPGGQAERLNNFLGGTLAAAKMAAVVDKSLYRERG